MKEVTDSRTVRIYGQRELALILGMEIPEGAKVTVTNTSDAVSIVVQSERLTTDS